MKTKIFKSGQLKRIIMVVLFATGIFSVGVSQTTQNTGQVGYRDTPAAIDDNSSNSSSPNSLSQLKVFCSLGSINLSFNKPNTDIVFIKIFDLTGKLIISDMAISSEVNVNKSYLLNGLSKGLYIVNIYDNSQSISRKFFV